VRDEVGGGEDTEGLRGRSAGKSIDTDIVLQIQDDLVLGEHCRGASAHRHCHAALLLQACKQHHNSVHVSHMGEERACELTPQPTITETVQFAALRASLPLGSTKMSTIGAGIELFRTYLPAVWYGMAWVFLREETRN
jgi:hypothetical protein